jgi:hypothetical protein
MCSSVRHFPDFLRPLKSLSRTPTKFILYCALLVTCLSASANAAKTTDTVFLDIGSIVIGEIKYLGRGMLEFKTDQMKTVEIKWNKVVGIASPRSFEIQLVNGVTHFGSILRGSETRQMVIATFDSEYPVDLSQVARIDPVESAAWQRFRGAIDIGFSHTKANRNIQWSSGLEINYTERKWSGQLKGDSYLNDQRDGSRSQRHSMNLTVVRTFPNRWFGAGLATTERNDELGLALRVSAGGAVGRQLARSSWLNFAGYAGVLLTNEQYTGSDPTQTRAEGILSLQLQIFKFEGKVTDLTTGLSGYPSLTTSDRFRIEYNARFRLELIKSFYWSLRFYYSYDSDPPSSAASKDDYGVTTSIGWSW